MPVRSTGMRDGEVAALVVGQHFQQLLLIEGVGVSDGSGHEGSPCWALVGTRASSSIAAEAQQECLCTSGDRRQVRRDCRIAKEGPRRHAEPARATAATADRADRLMRPSTPQRISRRMSSGSSTVQTFTGRPARCAWAMNRGEMIVVAPARSGTWNSRYDGRPSGQPTHERYSAQRASSREAPVEIRGSYCARGVQHAPSERAERHAVDGAGRAHVVDRAPRELRLVHLELDDDRRRPGSASSTSRRRGTPSPCPRNGNSAGPAARRRPEPVGRRQPLRSSARGERRDEAGAAGRPIERVVVVHDDDAVAGEVDVELEAVGAEREAVIERGDRVLRTERRSAAMRVDKRPRRTHVGLRQRVILVRLVTFARRRSGPGSYWPRDQRQKTRD